jgi:hypothetical protein
MQVKSRLAKSVHETLWRDCNPPPDELHIPYHLIVEDRKNPWSAFATVTYIVFCPTKKTHTVDIHFKYDKFGKFLLETMKYV